MTSQFTPIVISPPVAAAMSETDSAAAEPVYVYGKSGRCWTFGSEALAYQYFNKLVNDHSRFEKDSRFIDLLRKLVNDFGHDFGQRLRAAHSEYPTIEYSDYQICITEPDGGVSRSEPRTALYTFKAANISVKITSSQLPSKYEGDIVLQKLFSSKTYPPYELTNIYMACNFLRTAAAPDNGVPGNGLKEMQMVMDYVCGDGIFYKTPRPSTAAIANIPPATEASASVAPSEYGCWSWFRRHRIACGTDEPRFTPLHIHND